MSLFNNLARRMEALATTPLERLRMEPSYGATRYPPLKVTRVDVSDGRMQAQSETYHCDLPAGTRFALFDGQDELVQVYVNSAGRGNCDSLSMGFSWTDGSSQYVPPTPEPELAPPTSWWQRNRPGKPKKPKKAKKKS